MWSIRISDLDDLKDENALLNALSYRKAIQENAGQYWEVGEGRTEPIDDFWRSEALDRAKEIAETDGDEKAERFMRVVRDGATFIRDFYIQWLDDTRPKPKQRDAHNKVIRDYMEWAGPGITVEETDRKKAGAYISHPMSVRKLAPKTVERYRSSLSMLRTWLEDKGMTPTDLSNPWAKHRKWGGGASPAKSTHEMGPVRDAGRPVMI